MHWWTDDQYWSQCKGCVFTTVVGDIICEMQFSGFVQLGRWRCYVLLCLFVRHQVHKRGSLRKMCACGLHISASHYVYKYFVWSVWTQVLLLLSDVCVISSLQVPPSTHQSLCRSQKSVIWILESPESVQKSNSRNSPSGRVLVFKYIFGTTLWRSQQQLQVSGSRPYWQYFLVSSWVSLDHSLLAWC